MTSFSVIAPLPETEARESPIDAANDDPLGRVLAAPSECQLAPALVQAVTQNIVRSLIAGYLHEPPLAHWYRHAYTVKSRALAFHEVLEGVLVRLEGVAPDECARFEGPSGSLRSTTRADRESGEPPSPLVLGAYSWEEARW